MSEPLILAIDQGTTSTRAILFDTAGRSLRTAQRELGQIYPRPGWVEHDPEEIWAATLATCREALGDGSATRVAAIGITNQRETAVIWERDGGRPIHNAIVWQDRRGAEDCRRLAADGVEPMVRARTGLVLDSYFSATKIRWLLDHVPGARARAERGELAFGTIDSFLLWRLTGGRVHATDASNAARTLLFDIHRQDWDPELLRLFGVPERLLPEVYDNAADFGTTDLFGGRIPITGMAGDQQAATVGQACFAPGMVKGTYGTGCFLLANTGERAIASSNRLLTTPAYRLGGRTTYALEGSIFNAGSTVKWLRDELKLIAAADDTERLATSLDGNRGVYMVPAFTGLGAPHWDAEARAAILGLTRDAGVAAIARAALEAVCYQTRDLVDAMVADGVSKPTVLRADGGMAVNDWLLQFLADITDAEVERPAETETTALGAAYLAALQVGLYGSLDEIASQWRCERTFPSRMTPLQREPLLAGWHDAVRRVRTGGG